MYKLEYEMLNKKAITVLARKNTLQISRMNQIEMIPIFESHRIFYLQQQGF